MSKANLGWLYYKKLYEKGNDDAHIKKTFQDILKVSAKDETLALKQSFTLTTTYPGLIIGSGYAHGISSDEDIKMGFYFDHTSGLPTLPGSSIKGVLRSLFGYGEKEQYKEEKKEFIQGLLEKEIDVEKLAEHIFEGRVDSEPLSIYERDKFYEARIVKTSGAILQEDYITPHKDPLKNPLPIKIVKVAGGTTFEFSFELHDSKVDDIVVTADEKLTLFFQLLQFHGVGAKTNVGYGQFEEKSVEKFQKERKMKKEALLQEKESQKKIQEELQKAKELKDALASADTVIAKIKIVLENITDNKEIFDLLEKEELSDSEKKELIVILEVKIGKMPEDTPKNMKKAKTKWPIKIYKLLGL